MATIMIIHTGTTTITRMIRLASVDADAACERA